MEQVYQMRWIIIIIIALLLIAGTGTGLYLYNNRLEQDVNILLMGTDSSDEYTHHADTLIVVHFSVIQKKITFISIPRDTRVIYRKKTRKINSVYVINYNAGSYPKANNEMLKIVSTVLREEVNYYAQVDYDGIKEIVDFFGGVRVNIEQKMYYKDEAGGLLIDFDPGVRLLNGSDAVKYLRFRKDGNADVGRMDRQQKFMFKLAAIIMEKLNAGNILSLYARVSKSMNTNVPPDRAAYLYRVFRSYDLHDSSRFILPGVPFYEDKQAYWKVDSVKTKELFESRK